MYIYSDFLYIAVMRGYALQIAQNKANLRQSLQ